jgi:4-amino-4-deoxy-L-arabinose transferase-like glycosyltransferase
MVPYNLPSNLATLSYMTSLLIIVVIILRPRIIDIMLEKVGNKNYYIFPALISLSLFLINYYTQMRFFGDLLTANIGLHVYYDAGLDVTQGRSPYERDPLAAYMGGFGYGPIFAALLGVAVFLYDSPFMVALIIWMFYLATVLLAVKAALEFFDQRTALTLGLIVALNPIMWHMTLILATTDIFVSLATLLILYLFAKSSNATKNMLIAGVVTAFLTSIKSVSILVFGAALLSKTKIAMKYKMVAMLSFGFLFLLIHLAAYNFWGMEMIEYGYINPYGSSEAMLKSPLSLAVDFSLLSLPMDYGLNVSKELFSFKSYQICFPLLFLFFILLFSYGIIIWRRLAPSAAIVVVLVAFYLSSPLVHVAYFTWLFPALFLIAFLRKSLKSRIFILSFFIILIPRLWQIFVEKELGGVLSPEIRVLKTFMISTMAVILLFLSYTVVKGKEFMENASPRTRI